MPWLLDPERGFVLSANHRPIASFYDVYLGQTTGALGDTVRSWRLRELLTAKDRLTPEDVLAVHHDTTNPARREVVRLGLHMRDRLFVDLDEPAQLALEALAPWLAAGAASDLRRPGAALATAINLQFRFVQTPLTRMHGGGLSGLSRWLKSTQARLDADPDAPLTPDEIEYAERILGDAWHDALERFGPDPTRWEERARAAIQRQRLGYHVGLDAFASLDRDRDLAMPPLTCVDGSTIAAQRGQTYTQWVPLHDVDRARSILPPGQSERPDAGSRLSTRSLWEAGRLHPAPLSRTAVDEIHKSTRVLAR